MYPETFPLCMAQLNCLLSVLFERTKEWYECKYRFRKAALQFKKFPASLNLLKSNPWTSLLFDFFSADIPETETLKTWVLRINENIPKAIEKNPRCIIGKKTDLIYINKSPLRTTHPFTRDEKI